MEDYNEFLYFSEGEVRLYLRVLLLGVDPTEEILGEPLTEGWGEDTTGDQVLLDLGYPTEFYRVKSFPYPEDAPSLRAIAREISQITRRVLGKIPKPPEDGEIVWF